MVKVGICGCGFMGRTHYTIYAGLRNARVVAIADRLPARRNGDWSDALGNLPSAWPKKLDMRRIRGYATVEELAADPEVELVDVTLPTDLHADAVVAALKAGKHVLGEKPMARDSAGCRRILAAATKARRRYMTAQCIRFWPQYVKIAELVRKRTYGPLRSLTLRRLAGPPLYSDRNWLMNARRSGGALLDLHLHDVDFANSLLGKPARIVARGTGGPSGGLDHVQALWTYKKDLLVNIEGGWAFADDFPFHMSIVARCAKGTIEWDMNKGPDVMVYTGRGRPKAISTAGKTGWDEEIAYYVNCLDKGRKPTMAPPESTALSVKLAEAEERSIRTGKEVAVR